MKKRRRPAKVWVGVSVCERGGERGWVGGFDSRQRTSEVAVGPPGQCGDVTVVARATPATPPWGGVVQLKILPPAGGANGTCPAMS